MLHKGTTWRRKWSRMASSPRTSSFQCCNMAKSVGRFVTLFHQPERRIAESEAVTCRLLRSFILKLARLGVNMIKQAIWWWLALRAKILSQKALGLGTCLEQKTIEASLYKHNRLSFCYRMLVVAFCFQEPDSWFGHAKNLHWNHWRHSLFFFRCQIDLRTWSWHVNWPLWDIKVYKNISWFTSNLESEVTSPTLPCRVLSLAMPTHCSRHTKFMVWDCCDYETLGGTMNGREIGAIRATRQRSNQQLRLKPWGGWCQDVPPKSFSVYWDGSIKSRWWLCSKPSLVESECK